MLTKEKTFPIPCPDTDARKPSYLAHIVLTTRHYEKKIDWWMRVLGAEITFRDEMLCFITFDQEHHRIAIINTNNFAPKRRESTGLDHVAFTFSNLEDLLHTFHRLKRSEIHPTWSINHGPTTSIYYTDIDGVQVELQVENFESRDEMDKWMLSGSFKHNSIGNEFDPNLLYKKFHEGESIDNLLNPDSTVLNFNKNISGANK
ncbi:VOC family protein [Leptospira sp. GIMC2001]|uniref:VOC family protein n=1 Tax=Leptospira sp. GIMC2001 TaxID=1513297 RepID=UPI002349FE8D|nr:VOC family protein [Leptospira sp. GIMC2001]WCL49636.1 VOC family protein [Leptospira sp. GIMC2001]